VDARDNSHLWGGQYSRKLTDLLALRNEITRDVSRKLRARLSGADEQRLARNYTEDVEAYQLYLRGRYHLMKNTRPEIQTSISYFRQAIEVDPSYALAYAGLADAYRVLPLSGEMSPTEFVPQAKAAARKAVEIDDRLAEAQAVIGLVSFWFDWDWEAAENQFKRALELDPNSADAHAGYATLLSYTGRHAEAIDEIKRARELDPLNLRTSAIEGITLINAGRVDEGLERLQKALELEPNYWFAQQYAARAYIEKGMFSEAIAEARKAKEFAGVPTRPTAYLGYALAKSGRRAEARAEVEELLKLSQQHYVSPYSIAVIYSGLGERDETLAWLERGYQQRDPRMVFLKTDAMWNDLRGDPRFQDLMRRIHFE
jgi:tetratricopeptide (TPR) repeat protein